MCQNEKNKLGEMNLVLAGKSIPAIFYFSFLIKIA